ncbi:MAG: pyrrolysine--tRNA(Pyl) ligase small subunit [Firmicutes bacterium]|nr:pyrrolysine--tRNA(Pyl) ligase small subunit [Bacillota bacterium]
MSAEPAKPLSISKKTDSTSQNKEKPRFIRKHKPIAGVLEKIKLWPARSGTLHGIKSITKEGNLLVIETHCHELLRVRESKNSRAARWLRNKWVGKICPACRIPDWKINKFARTFFG